MLAIMILTVALRQGAGQVEWSLVFVVHAKLLKATLLFSRVDLKQLTARRAIRLPVARCSGSRPRSNAAQHSSIVVLRGPPCGAVAADLDGVVVLQ